MTFYSRTDFHKSIVADRTRAPDWREAQWILFWVVFHGLPSWTALEQMIGCGLTIEQAVDMLDGLKREPEE